jgi:hypothetical protein
MKRSVAILVVALGLVALTAAPAGANVPQGQGLESFGEIQCEGLGTLEIFGPRAEGAPTAFAVTGEHLLAQSFSVEFTDVEGNTFTFFKSYGTKAGMSTFTCTQSFEEPGEGSGVVTIVGSVIPPTA